MKGARQMRGLILLALGMGGVWIIGDEVAGNRTVSRFLAGESNVKFADWADEFKFVAAFFAVAAIIYATFGETITFWLLLLVLFSMLVANAGKIAGISAGATDFLRRLAA